MLARAVESLLRQSCQDWVCELHNDDPQDRSPQALIDRIADSRIAVVNHEENVGAIRTFNLFFKSVQEPYFALLEDDNWWEPQFLETMISAMSKYPQVQIAWANMRCWEEGSEGSWHDTGRNIWDVDGAEPRLLHWPDPRQMNGALHSNGAMLARSNFEYFPVPESINFAAIEPFSTGGVYMNFLGQEGEDRVRAAYGPEKYERLVAVKTAYDPTNFFRMNQNIQPATGEGSRNSVP